MKNTHYNTVIIGAGPAGYVAAIRCAQLGVKVAVVDQWHNDKNPALGGVCLNAGCIPSKALLESSRHYEQLSELQAHGIKADKITLDIKQMMQRKDGITQKLNQGIIGLFAHHKVDWIQGQGQLIDQHTVSVTPHKGKTYSLRAENTVLAMGSRPIELKIAPFDGQHIIDSTDALSLTKVPKKMGIIGAGAIGLELGTVWHRLGAEITLFEAADSFLPMLDQRLSRQARSLLISKAATLHLKCNVTEVEKKQRSIKVTYEDAKGNDHQATFDCLLVAVGRRPNTEHLTSSDMPLALLENGEVEVDEHCRTSLPNVYAIGDIVRGPKLAHKGSKEGHMVAELIAEKYCNGIDIQCIPSVIYTHPEVAAVGMNEAQLKTAAIPYICGQANFASNGRAMAAGEDSGSVKIIAHKESRQIIGAQIIGAHASELIQEIVTVMEFSGTADDIADIIHAHPSLSEVIHEAAADCIGQAIHKTTKNS